MSLFDQKQKRHIPTRNVQGYLDELGKELDKHLESMDFLAGLAQLVKYEHYPKFETMLNDEDELLILPPIGGG